MPLSAHNLAAGLLLALLVLSPLPGGSNGAVYWLLSAMVVFAAAALFFAGAGPVQAGLIGGVFAVYLAFLLVQIIAGISLAPRASALGLIRLFGYGVFFYLMVQLAHKRTLVVVFVSVTAYALLGFVMRYGGPDMAAILGPDAYPGSASGPFVNRNSFATYLGFGLLAGLGLAGRHWRRRGDPALVPCLAGLAVIAVVLVSSNSRMGLAATGLALMALAVGAQGWPRWGRLALALLALGALLAFGAPVLARFDTLGVDVNVRLALYAQVLDMIAARPWLGVGLDAFAPAFQGFHQSGLSADLVWDKAHNSYLTNWAEAGLVFGSIPALLGLWLLARFIRAGRVLGVAVLVLGGGHALVDFSLEIQANMYVFLALLAHEYAALPRRVSAVSNRVSATGNYEQEFHHE